MTIKVIEVVEFNEHVSDLSMGFRAKLGDIWSLWNHVEGPK